MKLYITDLEGCRIEVTDLDKAIKQTDFFKDCHHIPPVESDKERQAYWGDMYEKLTVLKKQLNQQENEND